MHILNAITALNYDSKDNHYLSIKIPTIDIAPWLRKLEKILSPIDFFEYRLNQKERDHNTHHITLIPPSEFIEIKDQIEVFIDYPVAIQIYGIGNIKEEGNETFFLVCNCHEASKIRGELNLTPIDFHITLGFKKTDIFDQPKNKSSLVFPFNKVE